MKECTTFTGKTFTPRNSQDKPKPKRIALVEEEEPKNSAEEMEELTVGKVVVEDF